MARARGSGSGRKPSGKRGRESRERALRRKNHGSRTSPGAGADASFGRGRWWGGLAALFLGALAVRLLWVVHWDRLRFDGHDRLYLRAFRGDPPDPSAAAHPGLLVVYEALGRITDDPRALVVLAGLIGALGVVGVAVAAGGRYGRATGLAAGALVALLGEHAAWSTTPYPVIAGLTLLTWAFAAPGPVAAALVALAAWLRPELALPALLRGRWGLGGAIGALAWLLTVRDPGWQPAGPLLVLPANLPMLRFLGPPVLALGLLGGRRAWPLVGMALLVHLQGSLFDDYGARHALAGGVLLAVATALAARRWGRGLLVVAALGLAWDTAGIARAWYDRAPLDVAGLPPGPPEGCVEVSEEPPLPGQAHPSHLRYLSGELQADCVVWGEEFWHRQWSSRGLRDRARRMRTLYHLEPAGARADGPTPRRYWRLLPRLPRWRAGG